MHRHRHREHRAPREFGFTGGPPLGRGFRGGEGGRGGRGRRGRFFDQGDLRLVILQLTVEKPRYGYEIIKAIEERLAGLYSPSPGVVYPTLTLLEEMGLVAIDDADGKKLYAATAQGQAHLEANRETLEGILKRMAEVNAANSGGPPPQIIRAIENVRMAIRLKLSRGPLTEDQIRAIAAEMDSLATRVEQI
jgi:DNA-binding PadR family transcriptional regulator